MNKKLLSLYNLKFNPFSPDVPVEALWVPPALESFCWRIEQQIGEGGFALAIGEPGSGKSASLRVLRGRLGSLREVQVGVLTRPQAGLADFYRELGELFGVVLARDDIEVDLDGDTGRVVAQCPQEIGHGERPWNRAWFAVDGDLEHEGSSRSGRMGGFRVHCSE